jgi:sec-independent protein translocase protein TatB
MFGMGFTEILIIAVIAILFLGPDKLPGAMVDIAKFFRSAKNAMSTVKDTLEEEMHVSDIKKEALAYKQELVQASSEISKATDIKAQVGAQFEGITESLLDDDVDVVVDKRDKKEDIVTFKKSKPSKEIKNEEIKDV